MTPDPELRDRIVAALRGIYDPEIRINIYDLGLIYRLDVDEAGHVSIDMTLTTPGCAVAQSLPDSVAETVRQVPGVSDVRLDVVWDPPWGREHLSEAARLSLGLY